MLNAALAMCLPTHHLPNIVSGCVSGQTQTAGGYYSQYDASANACQSSLQLVATPTCLPHNLAQIIKAAFGVLKIARHAKNQHGKLALQASSSILKPQLMPFMSNSSGCFLSSQISTACQHVFSAHKFQSLHMAGAGHQHSDACREHSSSRCGCRNIRQADTPGSFMHGGTLQQLLPSLSWARPTDIGQW